MKKTSTFLVLILLVFYVSSQAQTLIFSEDMGNPTATQTLIASNVFQNNSTLTFTTSDSGSINVRTTNPSSNLGALSNGNVFFSTAAPVNSFFSITGINASNFSNLRLQFGFRKESASVLPPLAIEFWNGASWIAITEALFSQVPTDQAIWYLSNNIPLPVAAQINNLQLRFVKTGATAIRIDDVRLTGIEIAPSVINAAVTNVTSTSATFSGEVIATGGSPITANGTVYAATSTNAAPTLLGSGVTIIATPSPNADTGSFTNNSAVALSPNVQYSYNSYATKNTGLTGYGTVATFFTLAATPTAPNISNVKANTLDIALGNDSNSSATTYAISETSTSTTKYVQNDGTLGVTAVYQNRATWGTIKTVVGLLPTTAYTFKVLAKNSLGTPTDEGVQTSVTTLTAANITISGTLSPINAIYGNQSLPTSFSLTAANLIGNLNIAAPIGLEVSITPGGTTGYASTQVIAPSSGAIAAKIIYFRFASTTGFGNYSGNITLEGDNYVLTVNFPTSSVAKRELTITGVSALDKESDGTTLATLTGTAFLNGVLPNDSSDVFVNATSATAAFNNASVGAGKPVTVSGYALSGSASANYNLIQPLGLTATITANVSSDIVLHYDSQTSKNEDINYKVYRGNSQRKLTNTSTSIGVMGFYIRDGGEGLNDDDNVGTELTAITFNVPQGVTNIRSARLFHINNSLLADETTVTLVNGIPSFVFTGLNSIADDDTQLPLNLRVIFNDRVNDNEQMKFTIASVTAGTAGSQFATFDGGGARSREDDPDINKIEVTANKLVFVEPIPSGTFAKSNMNPSPKIEARDENENIDKDFEEDVSMASTGTLSSLSLQPVKATAGVATFNAINHNEEGIALKLTATATGLQNAVSNEFTINPLITPTFGTVNPICAGNMLNSLPPASDNDITGTWAPPVDNMVTTTYTFTPTAGQNAAIATMVITVNPIVTPLFTAVPPIISGATLSPLPLTSNNGITGVWSPALNNTAQTNYTFTPDSGQCATTATLTIDVTPVNPNPTSPSQDQNYIKTTTYRLPNANSPVTSITYFDGLGRPMQQIAGKQSNSGKDIVTHIEYDAFGRQDKDYLPFASSQNNLSYIDGVGLPTDIIQQYQTNYQDTTPFSQKLFEDSPLNRVLKQAAPGEDWKLNSGHEIKFEYQTNGPSEVKLFQVALTPEYNINLIGNGSTFYVANELYKTITYDENTTANPSETAGSTVEFKNKEGQVVLKRTYESSAKHDTYYIYDIYGNLTYVIPPKASDLTIDTDVLDNLCYQYKYDYRNRLIEKKLPGKQWEFIVYDKLDRPVATGPALSPFGDGTSGWLITKYDVFNRPVYTGWQNEVANSLQRGIKQTAQNGLIAFSEKKATSNTSIETNITVNYTNAIDPSTFTILTVNYYDEYNFPDVAPAPTGFLTTPKGLATGSWTRVLTSSSPAGETSTTYYDEKARPMHSFTKNYLGGFTSVDNIVDFSGKTLQTITKHKRTNNDVLLTINEEFTYTPQDRLDTHTHQVNVGSVAGPKELLTQNTYDELGQLKSKNVGNEINTNPLQKVDYTYNIRGWLKGINNDTPDSLILNTTEKDLFAFKINYNTVVDCFNYDGKPLYNGNISETYWRTESDNVQRKYGYKYDQLNRLKEAIYQKPGLTPQQTLVTNNYNESLEYDKNGNILALNRNGDSDQLDDPIAIDNLGYVYENGNQLKGVQDFSNDSSGFDDNNDSFNDYLYDENGNLVVDANKRISSIKYNHLNLPTKISFSTMVSISHGSTAPHSTIEYMYTATGQKVKKTVTQGGTVTTTDYLSGFQYKDTDLQYFPHAEGYVRKHTTGYSYVYNYNDHLGNVRVSYEKDVEGNATIIDENNYYPFGMKHSPYNLITPASDYKYKYNGKELQDELGLNTYDYGFRHYMPDIGRWGCMDAHSESYFQVSPYNYAMNNPINMIDMLGLDPVYNNGKYYDKGKEVSWDYVLNWIQNHDGIAATYTFQTNAQGNTKLTNTTEGNKKDNTFIFNGKSYTANSYMTLMGRDDGKNNVGDFKDIVNLEDGYISQILGQAAYVFFDLHPNVETGMLSESLGGKIDYKNELFDMFGFNRRSLIQINGRVYNPNEAGNFLWGMVLEYWGGLISPNTTAQAATIMKQFRFDERWEQKAVSAGREYGNRLRNNKTTKSEDLILKHRLSNR